jgi:hypothetical protein
MAPDHPAEPPASARSPRPSRRLVAGAAVLATLGVLLPLARPLSGTPAERSAPVAVPASVAAAPAAAVLAHGVEPEVEATDRAPDDAFAGVPFVPFARKRGEWLDAVRLGLWPAERRAMRDPAYANPAGFHVVTPALRGHPVSAHFTIGEFAMRDGPLGPQGETYVVLERPLLDKLERVLADLAATGVRSPDLRVLSAFRAPRYNAGVEGAAPSSRHQFGDAADVVVDADGDGRMDDLNLDGRVDRADLFLVADAVARVERAEPSLVGGLGLYDAQGPSGPFLHVDVRGSAARWGTALRGAAPAVRVTPPSGGGWSAPAPSRPTIRRRPGCTAEGEMAVLCATRADLRGGG